MKNNTEAYRPHLTPAPNRLLGKRALVTGGARGIGQAIASRFAQEGADICIVDIDVSGAEQTLQDLHSPGACVMAVQADVADRSSVEQAVEQAIAGMGSLDVLVNNAGIITFGSLMECRLEDWDRMMAVDLTGAFHCTQVAAQRMVQQGRGGRLIHLGSTAALMPAPQQFAYSVAKSGLKMLSQCAALELAPHNITSNLLCPQGAITDINRELLRDPELMKAIEKKIPVRRLASVEEIAAAAAFLASDEAAFITGTELVHDGGCTISGLWWR